MRGPKAIDSLQHRDERPLQRVHALRRLVLIQLVQLVLQVLACTDEARGEAVGLLQRVEHLPNQKIE